MSPIFLPLKHDVCNACTYTGMQLQLRELFRLADPDHSKYIDPGEFKAFLADLQSLENDQGSLSRRAVHGVAVVCSSVEFVSRVVSARTYDMYAASFGCKVG